MVPNENTFQGLSNGSNSNLLSAAVMEKINKNTTNHLCNVILKTIETLKILARIHPSVSFLPQPISSSQETAEARTPRRAVMLSAKALQQ